MLSQQSSVLLRRWSFLLLLTWLLGQMPIALHAATPLASAPVEHAAQTAVEPPPQEKHPFDPIHEPMATLDELKNTILIIR